MNKLSLLFTSFIMAFTSVGLHSQSNPKSNREDITIKKLLTVPPQSVRIVYNPNNSKFYYSVFDNGDIYELTITNGVASSQLINTVEDHGIEEQMGGMMYYNNKLYVAGSIDSGDYIRGVIMKGTPGAPANEWTMVAKTEPYLTSNTWYDHRVNAIELDPTGQFFLINSGSRTDHGEVNLGYREIPITSTILKIPVNTENLIIPNDSLAIIPYLYADGTRNSFGIAYDAVGNVFATENSGDRDHPEEINWLREGKHYGFPWNMGGLDNPQQYDDYQPGTPPAQSSDLFIQPSAGAWYQFQSFKNDPTFPAKPESVDLMLPILNLGPDADKFRDTADFIIKDASEIGQPQYGFTPHRSPAGLVFDRNGNIGSDLRFGGFVVNFNNSGLLSVFEKAGDILHLDMEYVDSIDNFASRTTQLVKGFNVPPDLEIVGNELYVIEFSYGSTGALWKVTLPEYTGYTARYTNTPPTIDGITEETIWDSVEWAPINQAWVGSIQPYSDYQGKYKVCWNGHKLYFLVDVFDDVDVPMLAEDDPLTSYWNYDNVEIFIDEDKSGGNHQNNHNAFAYHISPTGHTADICDGSACNLSDNVEISRISNTEGNRIHSVWEIAINIYDNTFDNDKNDNSSSLVELGWGKKMGFGVSSGDNDQGHGEDRDNLFGSFYIAGENKNVAWQNASVFDQLLLVGPNGETENTPSKLHLNNSELANLKATVFPNPIVNTLNIELKGAYTGTIEMNLVNVAGANIFTKNFQKNSFNLTLNIPVNELSVGVYFLKILTDEGIKTEKIYIQTE